MLGQPLWFRRLRDPKGLLAPEVPPGGRDLLDLNSHEFSYRLKP
jgi:hypothetical protein